MVMPQTATTTVSVMGTIFAQEAMTTLISMMTVSLMNVMIVLGIKIQMATVSVIWRTFVMVPMMRSSVRKFSLPSWWIIIRKRPRWR